jgi:hypothetical protein
MAESDIRPAVSCPSCGRPPRLRFPGHVARYALTLPPGEEMQSYHCTRRLPRGGNCDTVYPIPARALAGRVA